MNISNVNNYSNMYVNKTKLTNNNAKPTWNGAKAYKYLEDANDSAIAYGKKVTSYYTSKTMEDGAMSVEDLKKQITEMFSDYTLTNREPKDVVKGKHYLYIDDSQLKKMAEDPAYRGKVYGLMDREMETGKAYTLTYSDGRNVTSHIIGSIFSLSEKNRKYAGEDGIPYLGSGMSDTPWSSSDSHPQVRNQSFLYDNLDPATSARKNRTKATKSMTDKLAKKRAEKKQAEKKAEAKKLESKKQKAIEEKRKQEKEKFQEMLEDNDTRIQTYDYSGKGTNSKENEAGSHIDFSA
ncbi:MAG: hypothetical protein Q4D51_12520 [Eubacteriales bacterium]|nr:hypothetical protein [Eubacteriales bacterium]